MKASFKLIGVSALALTLGFCGCGDKESGSGGGSAPSACAMFKPLVGKDVQLAIGVNLDKEQAFKIVDAYAGLVFDLSKLDEDDVQKAKEKIAAEKLELSPEMYEELDRKMHLVERGKIITVIYFKDDEYLKLTGMVARIDSNSRFLQIVNTKIPFDDILDVSTEN